MTFGSLFAGIGGFDLGLERAGMICSWQVEIDPYARRILEKHWPHVRRWDDARTFPPPGQWRVDLICGGFPCQPVSLAGKRQGVDDERWLWPDFARIIRKLRPRYAILENTTGLLTAGIDAVLGDLAALGYDAEWSVLSACAMGAPHTRERVFIVADSNGEFWQKRMGPEPNGKGSVQPRDLRESRDLWLETIPACPGGSNGVPDWSHRCRTAGNAVVPQVAEWIGRRIMEATLPQPLKEE